MVDVNTQNKTISINVSSSGVSSNVNASGDTSHYYSEKAREWAISNRIVDGVDYSSKYYANKSNQSALNAQSFAQSAQDSYNNFQQSVDGALSNIGSSVQGGIDEINNTKTTIINDIEFVADGEKKEIEELIDSGKDELKEAIGDVKVLTTLKIGQIGIAPLGIDETLNMERYLNGQIITQDQFKGFTQFLKKRVALYPSIACLEDEWQTIVTMSAFSQCGKFVIDDNAGTIRLPKVVNIQGLTDLSKLGEIVEAGLPNITGRCTSGIGSTTSSDSITWGGALGTEIYGSKSNGTGGSTYHQMAVNIDASLSNPIYGNSTTVQQEQIQYPYFIQVATGAEIEDNIINEIELNNPYSLLDVKWSDKLLNNISWLRSQGQLNSSIDYEAPYNLILSEYNSGVDETETVGGVSITFRRGIKTNIKVTTDKTAYDSILLATGTAWYYVLDIANSGFYLPQTNGFVQFGGSGEFIEAGLPNITGTILNGGASLTGGAIYSSGQGALSTAVGTLPCGAFSLTSNTGTTQYSLDASNSNSIYSNSDTVQPNAVKGYLYFYVGETVQNANLINAGRIEEKLVNKLDRSAIKAYITENYENGTSGYNIYSNRYCEQWGQVSVSTTTNNVAVAFLKEFEDTNYNIQAHLVTNVAFSSNSGTVNVNGAYSTGAVLNRCSATGFYICRLDDNRQIYWRACGYIL